MQLPIEIDREKLAEFCRRWNVREMSLFGSILSEQFHDESDVDVLVDFSDDADWSLLDVVSMKEELAAIFGRNVDLLTRRAVEQSANWIRRRAILERVEPIYAA